MSRILIAGPCLSELGWELMEFQGYVRRLAQNADEVIVCSSADRAALYADMKPEFIPHNVEGRRDCHRMRPGSITNPNELQRVRNQLSRLECSLKQRRHAVQRVESIPPSGHAVGVRRLMTDQLFVPYGKPIRKSDSFPVIVHARNRLDNHSYSGDNYPVEQWAEVVRLLALAGFSRVAAVGTHAAAISPVGAVDMRGIKLQHTMDLMAAAAVVIGPSSGPMHLASLCGTPHVVWTGSKKQPAIGANNKVRYERDWNPRKTAVHVITHDGSGPSPSEIEGATLTLLRGQ